MLEVFSLDIYKTTGARRQALGRLQDNTLMTGNAARRRNTTYITQGYAMKFKFLKLTYCSNRFVLDENGL